MFDSSRRVLSLVKRAAVVAALAVVLLLGTGDYRPGAVELAVAPYRFSIVGWELRNLPGKWLRRTAAPGADVREYFADGRRLRDIRRRIIALEAAGSAAQRPADDRADVAGWLGDRSGDAGRLGDPAGNAGQQGNPAGDAGQLGDRVGDVDEYLGELRWEQARLLERQSGRRPGVEAALEGAVADALRSLGFGGVIGGGVFPPVDTVLAGSPTVLVISPRDRIARLEDVILQTGLTAGQRASVEAAVEQDANRSALVVNTGGIAFYPSIAVPDGGLDYTLEIVAHEWVHHWLWFRPLGRRYFQGGDITAINETVADIAGKEISALARLRLPDGALPASSPGQSDGGKESDASGLSGGAPAPSSPDQSDGGKQSDAGGLSGGAPAPSSPGQFDGGKQSDTGDGSDGASGPSSSGQSSTGKQSDAGGLSGGAPAPSSLGQSDGGKQSDAGGLSGGGPAPSTPGQSSTGKQSDASGLSGGAPAPSTPGQSDGGKQSDAGGLSGGGPAPSTPVQSDGGKESDASGQSGGAAAVAAGGFDFSAEMRATRVRVDALLAAGEVAGAEAYMEERRRVFVANGYYIRRLNQAYFAFHGTYATSGAAGVSVVGEQVAELRRRSPSLGEFLRTAAQFTGPQDLRDYLDGRR